MNKIYLYTLTLLLFLYGCESEVDKSLISSIEKLNSPNNQFTLYRYFIESPMAFGSGFTAIKIFGTNEEVDLTSRNFYRFGNDSPIWMRWKNNNTVLVKCLIDGGGLSEQQPVKKETVKWKDWTFEVEYYTLFSTGLGQEFQFDSYSTRGDSLTFKSKNDSLTFSKAEAQITLDSFFVNVTEIKVDTFNNKLGLSLTHHKLKSKYRLKTNEFIKEQAFENINYKK